MHARRMPLRGQLLDRDLRALATVTAMVLAARHPWRAGNMRGTAELRPAYVPQRLSHWLRIPTVGMMLIRVLRCEQARAGKTIMHFKVLSVLRGHPRVDPGT